MSALDDKVFIITGSSRGIGLAAARKLAGRGAAVVISSRKQEACDEAARAIEEEGGKAAAIACHIGKEDQLADLVEKTIARFGRIDGVVMNAASNPVYGPSEVVDQEAFSMIMRNNVFSAMRLAHLARPHLEAAGEGSLVFVSSIAGLLGNRLIGAYGISKAAQLQLVRNLALELGASGIRVNAVAPGLVRTDFAQALLDNPDRVRTMEQATPLGRLAEPEDIAGVIAFLVSPDSGWVNGQVIVADGGITTTGGF